MCRHMNSAPSCISPPSGWPWAVCPADAYPHPDRGVCSQPDDGLQPALQPEPEAVSTPYSETYPCVGVGWVMGGWVAQWVGNQELCFPCQLLASSHPIVVLLSAVICAGEGSLLSGGSGDGRYRVVLGVCLARELLQPVPVTGLERNRINEFEEL